MYFEIRLKYMKKFQGFCKAQNRSKIVFKYLIKTVSETYFNLLYYFKTIFNGNFKRILKKNRFKIGTKIYF